MANITHRSGDVSDLVQFLFTGPVQPQGSVQFSGDFDSVTEMFEALLMIFTEAMRLRYGNHDGVVDLTRISNTQLADLTARFASISIQPQVMIYHLAQVYQHRGQPISDEVASDWSLRSDEYPKCIDPRHLVHYQQVQGDRLSDRYFQLTHQSQYFVISFCPLHQK